MILLASANYEKVRNRFLVGGARWAGTYGLEDFFGHYILVVIKGGLPISKPLIVKS